jgi:hypothetical protein
MDLKGYRLWVMGQLDSNVYSPAVMYSIMVATFDASWSVCTRPLRSAAGCVLERHTLKPVFHLIGYMLWV